MEPLTSAQRKRLRGLAHGLDPVVHVGKGGLSAELLAQVDRALEAHELIKVRFLEGRPEADELEELARRARAAGVGRIGKVGILFRRHPDPVRRAIEPGPP